MEVCLFTYNPISPLKFTINYRHPFRTAIYLSRAILYAAFDALRLPPLLCYLRAFNVVAIRAVGYKRWIDCKR
jgi:hypothetical protein